jgi:hypothetical protein
MLTLPEKYKRLGRRKRCKCDLIFSTHKFMHKCRSDNYRGRLALFLYGETYEFYTSR